MHIGVRHTAVRNVNRHKDARRHSDLMTKGLQAHGHTVTAFTQNPRNKVVACWGWRKGRAYKPHCDHVIVMERGYLGDRFKWTSIALDGLNGRATWPAIPDDGGERFRAHYEPLKPWRTGGEYILICGQVLGDASLQGKNLYGGWYDQVAKKLERYGLPVYFRPHPKRPARINAAQTKNGELDDAMEGAALIVTYNSNTTVDALVRGRPVLALGEGHMAPGVALSAYPETLDVPEPENRQQWAHDLAWKQWSGAEIESGEALKGILGLIG